MSIDRIGAGFKPAQVQDTSQTQAPAAAQQLPASADLPSRTSNAASASPPRVRRESAQQVQVALNEVSRLLEGGGAAVLEQGAREGFRSLPPQYQGLALQTARLAGIAGDSASPAAALSPASLLQRLDLVAGASTQLIEAARLDLASALTQSPQARADALKAGVEQIKESSSVMAASVKQTSVGDLLANREAVKEKLSTWADQTAALHEQLKAQLGDVDPVTVAALQARTEASATMAQTMARMAVGRLGRMAFNLTVGPAVSAAGAAGSALRSFLGM
jgi:hypothetical protein